MSRVCLDAASVLCGCSTGFLLEISCTYTSVDFVSSELAVLASRDARVTFGLLKAKPVWEVGSCIIMILFNPLCLY